MSSSSEDDDNIKSRTSNSIISSCRKLAAYDSSPPVESISLSNTSNLSYSTEEKKLRRKKQMNGVVNSCLMLAVDTSLDDSNERDSSHRSHVAKKKEEIPIYRGVSYFMNHDDQIGQDLHSKEYSYDAASRHDYNVEKSVVDYYNSDDARIELDDVQSSRKSNAGLTKTVKEDKDHDELKNNEVNDSIVCGNMDQYMELPASTLTLLHTEPIFSITFLFSLGIATLSAMCLILVLVSEFQGGEEGNWLDVPTGISSSVRAAQNCGIFVGLLMEEEIPQGLILLRDISRESFQKSYPNLSFNRFIFSCILRLVMGYLFLLNLFVTIVQADDVITIFFDILALEFVQHLDDMAFELGRKNILGRNLHAAASVEYKVLTRTAFKRFLLDNQDEENAFIRKEKQQPQQDDDDSGGEWRFYCIRRRKKLMDLRWILKAAYFINLGALLMGTIIVGTKQQDYKYHCSSVSITFGDEVWENAYVSNETHPSEEPDMRALVYSYFNGVYKITDKDRRGYPIYTEMNKLAGEAYTQTIAAEIVYCTDEEAWVFRHKLISKVLTVDEEAECSQWLLRSPKTKVYDLVDVPREDWSVWTGIITPGNKVGILCNTCNHNSDCNYHGDCMEDGGCVCDKGFFGVHCEFNKACPKLLDDEGEIYTLASGIKNDTLFSYMRPVYLSRSFDFVALIATELAETSNKTQIYHQHYFNKVVMSDLGSSRGNTRGRSNRPRRAGGSGSGAASSSRKSTWTSDHPTLKNHTFTEGTAESAAQFVESLRKYLEHTRGTASVKEANLIADAIEREQVPVVPAPPRPPRIQDPDQAEGVMIDDDAELAIWQERIKMVARKRDALQEGLKQQYAVLKGQCSPAVIGRLKGEEGWGLMEEAKDPIMLIQRMRRICCGFDVHKQPMYALGEATRMLYTYIQRGETNEKYKEGFEAICNIIEQFGGSVASHPNIADRRAAVIAAADGRDAEEVQEADLIRATKEVTEEMKAVLMIGGANEKRYGALKNHLANAYTLGDDKYPRNLEQALSLLNNYRPPETRHLTQSRPASGSAAATAPNQTNGSTESEGIQCLQSPTPTSNGDAAEGAVMAQAKAADSETTESGCYHCGKSSHWIMDCPELTEAKKGQLFVQLDGAMVSQAAGESPPIKTGGLRRNYLYLDTCTTNDQVVNGSYLTGLHRAENPLKLHTNAGTSISERQGYLGNHLFWLDPHGIANVVSLRTLEGKHKVTYHSDEDGGAFIVHTNEGEVHFKRCPNTGFPYIDLDDHADESTAALLVQSVRGNYEGFTRREVERAREARDLQGMIGHPSEHELKALLRQKEDVSRSILHDCPVSATDVLATDEIPTVNSTNVNVQILSTNDIENTCYPIAKKIRIESTTSEQIAMFEFQAYSLGANVALQGKATQSSDRNNGQLLAASRAIDGDNITFSHTNDLNAFWEVDLDQSYSIESITILNRYCGNNPAADPIGCLCRLSNSTLSLLDESGMVVANATFENTCNQWLVSEVFATQYGCLPSVFNDSTLIPNNSDEVFLNNTVNNATSNSYVDKLNEANDKIADLGFELWFAIALVYSGSRWFGTLEFGSNENFSLGELSYGAEYHAFWDKLYDGRTFFISDPATSSMPVGNDFYENDFMGTPLWNDYGPFGLLTPIHNISGKGYFHCLDTNLTTVKVASGTGDYGD